jgi:hypothetical protein
VLVKTLASVGIELSGSAPPSPTAAAAANIANAGAS